MDLYAQLGVSRAASAEDIERAYRRLARRYHPGVNPGDARAAQLYRDIQDAYAVLGDRQRRQEYDRGARRAPAGDVQATVTFEGFDFASAAEGPLAGTFSELFADVFQAAAREATAPSRGAGLEIALRLSFEDAVRGGRFPLSVLRHERCPACDGEGRVPRPARPCPACGGTGSLRWARGHLVFTKPCGACDGGGRIASQPCGACGGVGVHPRSEVVTVAVPPGVESGARIAVPGRGHAGARGGVPGDLYVTIEVAPHRFFGRDGRDLHVTLPVAVHEAVLGARVDVPTLDGPVRLRIPPGTASGQRLRLRGRGVPSPYGTDADAGDLIVEVLIVLPPVRDERSRELLREFGRLNDVDVRRHLFEGSGDAAARA
jgi:molecular chaperone DnaJ